MNYYKKSAMLVLSGILVVGTLSNSTGIEASGIKEYGFSTRVYGPGVNNLSVGDPYARYQWGLRNDGELQYLEVVNRFKDSNPLLAESIDLANSLGIPAPVAGPSAYEIETTDSVEGIDINIQPAWELYDASTKEHRPVIVAVIDTGVDINHPELKDAIWVNEDEIPGDGIDNDGNGYIDDVNGWNFFNNSNQVYVGEEDDHGTHAAGTIAAARKSMGVAGIADNKYVKIMPLKALGTEFGIGEEAAVIAAIQYAEANGASICNLSFGTEIYYPRLEQVMRESKMLFISAAGNGDRNGNGLNADTNPDYPASFKLDNSISVANLMFDGNLAKSSNYSANIIDIAAPGTYIVSTTTGDTYGFMTGTSMAAPMVTGVAAFLYSYRTDIGLQDVKIILMNSSRPLEGLKEKVISGGMIDAYAALTYKKE
ncbi:MAG: S8 family serine peptidase [Lachnospiraceae bacterium]|jgi:subtilisin family serine protease|nr:S8 family serine peptidase [Lachnospiraceae bacterium]